MMHTLQGGGRVSRGFGQRTRIVHPGQCVEETIVEASDLWKRLTVGEIEEIKLGASPGGCTGTNLSTA